MQYLDLYREIEIQSKLMEVIYPLYEQMKLEEARETPTVLVLDHAVPPLRKARPMRSLIVLSALVLGFVLSVVVILFLQGGIAKDPGEGDLRKKYHDFSVRVTSKLRPDYEYRGRSGT
jgi:uncharacterized protein involved in exopolysaccharide biosynthesis